MPLREGSLTTKDLRRVQRRRQLPTRLTQRLQSTLQKRVIQPALEDGGMRPIPRAATLLEHWPVLRRIPAYVIGVGFRPEHVQVG